MNTTLDNPAPGGLRELLKVAAPLIISMGSFTLMQFTDRMFLAWHSPTSVQAALPAGILAFTLICGFMELAGYANAFVAQHFGAGQPERCSRATGQAVIIALLSWPLILCLIPAGLWIIRISGHPPATTREEMDYFTILMLGGVTSPLGVAMATFFTGRGRTAVTMAANLSANVVNMVLAYGLIFGRWGFPELGIRGAAIATVAAGFISPAILLALFLSRKMRSEFQTQRAFHVDRPLFLRMLRFGIPASANVVLDVSSFTFFVMLIGRFGETALTASNIAFTINNITFMPMLGLSIATATLVGQYQGRRNPAGAQRVTWTALKLSTAYMGIVGVTFILIPEVYFSFFTRWGQGGVAMEDLLPMGRTFLILMAVWNLFDSVNLILSGALKGAGDTRFVMIYSLSVAWGLWVGGQLLILWVFHGGVMALWIWLTIYVAILAVGYVIRFVQGRWKTIELIDRHIPPQPNLPGAEALITGD